MDAFAIILYITEGETFKWVSIKKHIIYIVLKPLKIERNLNNKKKK